ncbi:store-operated calcium entry regulator STIMATE isoform X2 [Petromyzon marinus]|uniref:Store-operated calcium entry regulator STIMATE-like n=1 Tax=Petromyzon marinus TaxID=7757 RepID=A0AAJ7U284_PETMA|nr:store-operated calcium entry regulator STIMATE-like [Petromyzon marinus]
MNGPPGNASVGSGTGATGPVLSPITGPASNPAGRPHGCENGALMDQFGVFIQALLALVAFSTLMLKRFREPCGERRPWRIWLYDTSKQIFGQLFIHFANVYLSELTEEDPCSLYLINFLLDATLGMVLIWLGIKAASRLVEWRQWESLRFGEYGEPPRCCAWVGQCGVYLLVVACEKTITFLVILIPFWKKVQELILSLIPNPQVELALVMLIVPFVVNAVMFWLTDNFLMKKGKVKAKSDGDDAGSVRYYRRAASRDDSESEVLLSPDESDKVDSDRDTRRLIGNGTAAKKKKVRFEMPV